MLLPSLRHFLIGQWAPKPAVHSAPFLGLKITGPCQWGFQQTLADSLIHNSCVSHNSPLRHPDPCVSFPFVSPAQLRLFPSCHQHVPLLVFDCHQPHPHTGELHLLPCRGMPLNFSSSRSSRPISVPSGAGSGGKSVGGGFSLGNVLGEGGLLEESLPSSGEWESSSGPQCDYDLFIYVVSYSCCLIKGQSPA